MNKKTQLLPLMKTFNDNIKEAIYTIGHSSHPIDMFIRLLTNYNIEVLVDVRSNPYSKYSPQFDMKNIKKAIKSSRIKYLYLGKELGGKPKGKDFYDLNGNINYSLIADSQLFHEGISRLEKGLKKYRVAIMCSEENPAICHRWLLVGRALVAKGINVNHIRGNGDMETQDQLETHNENEGFIPKQSQLSLFEG